MARKYWIPRFIFVMDQTSMFNFMLKRKGRLHGSLQLKNNATNYVVSPAPIFS